MAIIQPAVRNVNVTVERKDNFPTIQGFGVPLLLTGQTVTDKLDATLRTRSYSSIAEVALDFAATDEFYIAANDAFSQNPRPAVIKAGWYDNTITTAAELQDELNDILAFDPNWYWIDVEADLRDDLVLLPGLVAWVQANYRIAMLTSNDADTELLTTNTSLAFTLKDTVDRTAIFYHDVPAKYLGFATAARLATFDFDNANTNYTAKYKGLKGFTALNKPSAVVNVIQGWVPGQGQSATAGNMANCMVNQGGQIFLEQGSTLTANTFIDQIHFGDWLKARTEEAMMALLLNENAVTMDDIGLRAIGNVIEAVLVKAENAGFLATIFDDDDNVLPKYTVTVPSIRSVSSAQRNARIAPAVTATFQYSGAVHYAVAPFTITF